MKRRGLLLDRDGIINVDHDYVGSREKFEFIPAVFPFLRAVRDKGFQLAILTNQSGVARGFYTPEDYDGLTHWMLKELAGQGITIDLILHCFEHVSGTVPVYSRESFWRKPNPGMVLDAVQKLQLDPARSAFLGDHLSDIQAARVGGIQKCLMMPHPKEKDIPEGITIVRDYDEALRALD